MASVFPPLRKERGFRLGGARIDLVPLPAHEARVLGFKVLLDVEGMPPLLEWESKHWWGWRDDGAEVVLTRLERTAGVDVDRRNCTDCEDGHCVSERRAYPVSPFVSTVVLHGCRNGWN